MSRLQLALRVPDLAASVAFYTEFFATGPAKVREGYANFAIAEPPLKLVLIEGDEDETTRIDHLGVEVGTSDAVRAATARLGEAGLATTEETDTTCCHALQDKVWVRGPGREPWEVYVVKADADADADADACRTGDPETAGGCCPPGGTGHPTEAAPPPDRGPAAR
ncbi:glyoxalase/bleomycin resistance/dioxygenase family protein [Streptomyces sp. PKU-MA01144]|uniref:ArsI/CadI family heavy metal resistance metalloenzyme n=1 Tax=Streptomyces sp. PKU-MA01144 TaxID=2729138 RepID=UPI0014813EE4|nr:ArsI/CadI family heavy metal resistance metalloenzyme [Streptomyces sp. PKU-MA01144]NNJ06236.1 glyoxalase/bleomycin resistance/dioxygenase family protein [Streptomyces sp. PKU-MA01144]